MMPDIARSSHILERSMFFANQLESLFPALINLDAL